MKQTRTMEEYISSFPKTIQKTLQKLRRTIKESAPLAKEAMSYRVPAFKMDNEDIILFAAFKKHVGIYPKPRAIVYFKRELINYKTSKGTIRFPLDKPIPFNLVRKIVKYRIKENLQKKR